NRRAFVTLLGAVLAAPLAAEAQQPAKNVRIGVLAQGFPDWAPDLHLMKALRDLGWVEGRNVVFEFRYDEGKRDRLSALATELAGRNVDVILTRGTPPALAAKAATRTIPIVMIIVTEPVRSGLVTSLARPGGNITGMASVGADIFGKQLEVLKQIVPGATTVAVLFDPLNPAQTDQLHNELAAAAAILAGEKPPPRGGTPSPPRAGLPGATRQQSGPTPLAPPLTEPTPGR